MPKNWCFWTLVSEKTLESHLDCKEIKPFNPKGNQSWTFFGRSDAEAETLIVWPPDVKNWLIGKDPDAGKDWRLETKGMTEDEMTGWITNTMDMSLSKLWESLMEREAWRSTVHGVTKHWTWLSNWNELNWIIEPMHTVAKGWLQNECSSTSDWINYGSCILFYMAIGWIMALRCIIIVLNKIRLKEVHIKK